MKNLHDQVGPELEGTGQCFSAYFFDKKHWKSLNRIENPWSHWKLALALTVIQSHFQLCLGLRGPWTPDLLFSSSYKPGFSLFSRDEQKVHRMDLRFRIFVGEPEDERGPVLVTDRKSSPQRSNHHMHQPIMESLDREVPCCLWRESLNQVKVTSRPRPYSEWLMKIHNQKGVFFVHRERNRRK